MDVYDEQKSSEQCIRDDERKKVEAELKEKIELLTEKLIAGTASYQEIADICGITVDEVKNKRHNAVLKEKFEADQKAREDWVREDAIIKDIKNMMKYNIPLETIASAYNMTVEQVIKLLNDISL